MNQFSADINTIPSHNFAGLTEKRFWELVDIADWPNSKTIEAKLLYLRSVKKEEGISFRKAICRLFNMVDEFIGDRNPAGGGDDSHSDLCYHIIGLGKESFYKHMNDYRLIKERGKAPYGSEEGYRESFSYCVPHIDEWENADDTIADILAKNKDLKRLNDLKSSAESNGKSLIYADQVISQIAEILIENDGEFIEHIANQVLGNKVKYIEDSFFEIDA